MCVLNQISHEDSLARTLGVPQIRAEAGLESACVLGNHPTAFPSTTQACQSRAQASRAMYGGYGGGMYGRSMYGGYGGGMYGGYGGMGGMYGGGM